MGFGMGAGLAVAVLIGPGLVVAADRRSYSSYTPPSQPPPVRQQFNSAAQPPLKQKFNNSSGATTQSGRSSASTQTGPKRNTRQGTPQVSSRGLHNSLESKVPDPNAQNPKPTRPRATTAPGGSAPR